MHPLARIFTLIGFIVSTLSLGITAYLLHIETLPGSILYTIEFWLIGFLAILFFMTTIISGTCKESTFYFFHGFTLALCIIGIFLVAQEILAKSQTSEMIWLLFFTLYQWGLLIFLFMAICSITSYLVARSTSLY